MNTATEVTRSHKTLLIYFTLILLLDEKWVLHPYINLQMNVAQLIFHLQAYVRA